MPTVMAAVAKKRLDAARKTCRKDVHHAIKVVGIFHLSWYEMDFELGLPCTVGGLLKRCHRNCVFHLSMMMLSTLK